MPQAEPQFTQLPPSLQLLRADLLSCLSAAAKPATSAHANTAEWSRLQRAARRLRVHPRVFLQGDGRVDIELLPLLEPAPFEPCWWCRLLGGVHTEDCQAR